MTRRLYSEVLDGEAFTFITDFDPFTGEPCGLRIVERNTKFGGAGSLWAKLDLKCREISRIMQGKDT